MDSNKENKKINKVEGPATEYEIQNPRRQGIDLETFNFDAEFAKGLTLEEAKKESIRKIREWWTDNFDHEFENGLTPEQFKIEMYKRIKSYPWKK
ncbi:MAG: hypothetical protein J7574_21950 [Flavobacterium sp.]|uniref:hypothetical protein n=1 Tax=Flavobacterium sp. TaxID=239 RepID=UPI001B16AD61|nr:hypothetical protein [Flavobacterium sp.]MBO9586837.1 hypothetical protein [Flavobacterium sp.]